MKRKCLLAFRTEQLKNNKQLNMKTTTALALILTAVILGATSSASAAPLSKEDDQGIRKTIQAIVDTWNAHDMKAFAQLLHKDAEWINVVGMHWKGRDAVVKAHQVFHETIFQNTRLALDNVELRPLDADYVIAVVTTTQDSFTTPEGNVQPKGQTKQSYIFKKATDGWKIYHAENVRIDAQAAKFDPTNATGK